MKRFIVFLTAILLAMPIGRTVAGDLAAPTGPVIIEVRGHITQTNQEGVARLDLPMLQAIGMDVVTTQTPWTEGKVRFEGVRVKALIDRLGGSGTHLLARALNDYQVDIPLEDFRDSGAILAVSADGKRLTARDKGPVWLIYPFDDRPDLNNPIHFDRAIWQLKTIEIQ
ncbi:MAG: molybdopterin-dependent oxidoreductase [Azospirillaceae bacterium]|nr:molybdopterin-dependent oxidoreductase [Azospirillaceae bacterium]